MNANFPRIAFAGNNKIAVQALKFIIEQGVRPKALFVADENLVKLCPFLNRKFIFKDDEFKSDSAQKLLRSLKLDYIISIHFPFIYPEAVLKITKHGVLNLHPAYLPYNRGWHTPTWAIIDKTPYGATLHFMDKTLDTGDIVHQKKITVLPQDTGHSLYQRVLKLELEVLKEAWTNLVSFNYRRTPQTGIRTAHQKKELTKIQRIDDQQLIDKIRALTTNRLSEASYFIVKDKKYRVRIKITPEK